MKQWVSILCSLVLMFGLCLIAIFLPMYLAKIWNEAFNWIFWGFITCLTLQFITTLAIFLSKRRIEVKLSWVLVVVFAVFFGMITYMLFGRKHKWSKKKEEQLNKHLENSVKDHFLTTNKNLDYIRTNYSKWYKSFLLTTNISKRAIYNDNQVEILFSAANTWKSILSDIEMAKSYVLINYFIVKNGELLNELIDLLHQKIQQGVKIYFLYDHVGSYFSLSSLTVNKLEKIGVVINKFSPIVMPFLKGNTNYRTHRKDIIIDGEIGYTGGVNLADSYISLGSKYGLFHDTHIRIKGSSVKTLELIFIDSWYISTSIDLLQVESRLIVNIDHPVQKNITNHESIVQVIDDGPNKFDSIHQDLYLSLIGTAKKRIWLSTPYFIPPNDLINALKIAVQSGIDVKLVVPGLSDKLTVLDITRSYYEELLECGVEIYELNQTFNHSKAAVFDDDVAIVGTTNLDHRSFFQDYQTLALILDPKVVEQFESRWQWDFTNSTRIYVKQSPLMQKKIFYRLFISFLKIISPIL